jgi:hypothetical protein
MEISNIIGLVGIFAVLVWVFKSMAGAEKGGGCGH